MKLLQQVQLNPAGFSEICLKTYVGMFVLSTALNPAYLSAGISFTFSPMPFFLFIVYSAFIYISWAICLYSTLAMDSLPACSMCFQWHFFYLFLFWTFFQDLETLTPLSKHHHHPPTKKTNTPPNQTSQKTCASALSYLCQEASLGLFHLLCSGFFRTLFPPHIFACSPWAVLYKQPLHLNLHTPSLFICINWCCLGVPQIAAWPSDWSKPMSEQIKIII